MNTPNLQTAERISATDASDNFVFQRSLLAYLKAAELVGGRVLEIGTGSGYGIDVIAGKAEEFMTIDKFDNHVDLGGKPNVRFLQMSFPQMAAEKLQTDYFDYVISFQVVEHVKEDDWFIREIKRVLKPGGKLIIATPNIRMSLTRNPWHVREYTPEQLTDLLARHFTDVEAMGVMGNGKVMAYYEENKKSVRRITRWDVLDLQHRLPRWMLQLPYDILNRMNRRKLLKRNTRLTQDISYEDYAIGPVTDACFDLFYIASGK